MDQDSCENLHNDLHGHVSDRGEEDDDDHDKDENERSIYLMPVRITASDQSRAEGIACNSHKSVSACLLLCA
jgi:hypothetical protein